MSSKDAPIGQVVRRLRMARRISGSSLARAADMSPQQLHYFEVNTSKGDPETRKRIARGLAKLTGQEWEGADLAKGTWGLPSAQVLSLADSLREKTLVDLRLSALSATDDFIEAIRTYNERVKTLSNVQSAFRSLTALGGFSADTRFLARLRSAERHAARPLDWREALQAFPRSIPDEIKRAADVLSSRRLRIASAPLPGPVATLRALRDRSQLGLPLVWEVPDRTGVELMHRVAGNPGSFDFFFVAMGTFNLSLALDRGVTCYHPLLPIHYEQQRWVYRKTTPRAARHRMISALEGSSVAEELRVTDRARRDGLKIVWKTDVEAIAEKLANIDQGEGICLWDPISERAKDHFDWLVSEDECYRSLIFLYQHERYLKKDLREVAAAFMTVFSWQWNKLRSGGRKGIEYLQEYEMPTSLTAFGNHWKAGR